MKKDEEVEVEVTVSDSIPNELSIDKVYVGNNEIKDYVYNINRKLTFKTKIKNGENEKIRVITIVNKQEDLSKDIEISNKFEILLNTDIYTTNNIINIMQKDKNINPDDPDNPINPDDPVKNEFVITGTAWCDENEDGIRNDNEKVLEGIPVYLYNVKTNKIDENYKEITDTNGKYKINVEKGEYLVLFDYDSSKYKLSKYKVEGAQESINSNVVAAKVSVNGEEKIYAVSDRIQITDKSAANINIGLIELKTLDIKLEKNIKRIVVQDSTNTIVYDYNDESLAKVELNAKKVAGTTIIVEYEIKVTNVGEVDAYIRKIKDFMPQDMIFKSELNKDWYLNGKDLYTSTLSNKKLKAGETETLKLILTKGMNASNVGLINNKAEIMEIYTEDTLKEKNTEDNIDNAKLIVSIKTGEFIKYSLIIILAILFICILTITIIRKKE